MDIQDIQAGQGNIAIEAEVVKKGEVRTFEKFGKQGKVCNATLKDKTGSISLTLWNEQVDQIQEGNHIKIQNGYASEFRGEKQLSTGKFGTLEIIEKGQSSGTTDEKPKEIPQEKPSYAETDDDITDIEEENVG